MLQHLRDSRLIPYRLGCDCLYEHPGLRHLLVGQEGRQVMEDTLFLPTALRGCGSMLSCGSHRTRVFLSPDSVFAQEKTVYGAPETRWTPFLIGDTHRWAGVVLVFSATVDLPPSVRSPFRFPFFFMPFPRCDLTATRSTRFRG